ncbi:reductive dehalogenase [Amylibacter sp.]|nr:reductive dehalogenase [Amylibacter sp.]
MTKFFSEKNRFPHLGPYPMERLKRVSGPIEKTPRMKALSFDHKQNPHSIINAMRDYQAMMDAMRSGLVNKGRCDIPSNLTERSNHLKSFAYFQDCSVVGITKIDSDCHLKKPIYNLDIERLSEDLRTKQTKTFAAGIDVLMAELREAVDAPNNGVSGHTHAVVFIYEFPRDPLSDEIGCDWIQNAQSERATLLGTETANVISNYIRLLGYDARSHSTSCSDVDLNRLAVLSGLATVDEDTLTNPFIGTRFGITAVTTNLKLETDLPLAKYSAQPKFYTHGFKWLIGLGYSKSKFNREPYKHRKFVDGAMPFEKTKRTEIPTTYLDEPNIPRVPKRTDLFARAQFGDLGKAVENGSRNGFYVRKTAPSMAQRKPMSAFVLLQNKPPNKEISTSAKNAKINAQNIKAACYFLGIDAVGISRCPDWAYYSHDAAGEEIKPTQDQAISMIVDQRFDTMDGSSGDDWISVALSMRAYLRFSLLGGVIAEHIRSLGYEAKAHTATDSDVIHPPLLLLSGLGEVSRIGEVILNPYLGPRLKSGIVTTNMPMEHDKPIDFGMQKFCESCNKCARECPAGAITAGPKKMFNGYEIWKSDSQRCATYRITTAAGAMCGRCMKTCPWNLEGLFSEKPFRWVAMNIPSAAPFLAKLDDWVGNGERNLNKKWWWDLEIQADEGYRPTSNGTNERNLQKKLDIKYSDQTLAVYPADQAPHPFPFPFPINREEGIKAYSKLLDAKEYKRRLSNGDTKDLFHRYSIKNNINILHLEIINIEKTTDEIIEYSFALPSREDLPVWSAGAHVDVVVAPGFIRQYSLTGNPFDRKIYQIAVLKEENGTGGSVLMHKIFTSGRKIFTSYPINHFPLKKNLSKAFLIGGGIGITPLIAMAHELHKNHQDFSFSYCSSSRNKAALLKHLSNVSWKDKIKLYFSDEGKRANFNVIFGTYKEGYNAYVCGPNKFMYDAQKSATSAGFPEEAVNFEYFAPPEVTDYKNHSFKIKLLKSNREFEVQSDQTVTDVLLDNGIHVDMKCTNGICGVCRCGLISGKVEHRDFVLSNKEREDTIILCQSRALDANGTIEIDL